LTIPPPHLSVLIATRNRAPGLQRVLSALQAAQERAAAPTEIIVIDNGSTDPTASVLDAWCAGGIGRRRLCVQEPGRSRALNAGIAVAQAPLLAFTDDDVFIPATWIAAILRFFHEHEEYAAAMGRMQLPPAAAADPVLRELVARYRTVPIFDRGDEVCATNEFYGANVTVRRSVFEQLGLFDERLGVGASGNSEDFDLAARMHVAGMKIGYIPEAVIYHEVDRARLTPQFHRQFQQRLGQSEVLRDQGRFPWRSLPRLLEGLLAALWSTLVASPVRRTRAWGRVIRHTHALRFGWALARRRSRTGPPPCP